MRGPTPGLTKAGGLGQGEREDKLIFMNALTLDQVLTGAGKLPADEQEMLEDLLRNRRIEAWRGETAGEAKKAAVAFRSGKLKAQSVDSVIARLRASK